MSLQFVKASTSDALTLTGISKRSFDSDVLNVGRIFVAPEHFRKGYETFMMQEI